MKKTSRTFKRFAAITSASLLAACAVAPVTTSAVDITIIPGSSSIVIANHTFEAYQIFTGGLDSTTNTLTNVQWGDDIDSAKFITALNTNKTELGISEIASSSSAATVAEELAKITNAEGAADKAKLLANIVNDSLKESPTPATSNDAGQITGLDPGYYFVKDASNSGIGAEDAKTRFILKVTDSVSVPIKTDAPSLEKKIKHNETGEWGDVGDNQIGDTVEYRIATTVPNISDFDTYKYVIRDNMEPGLSYKGVTKITYVTSGNTTENVIYGGDESVSNTNISIKTGDYKSDDDYEEDFYVDFNLKSLNIPAGSTIYTYYEAVLNGSAEVSTGADNDVHNDNEAFLTYSNNPNQSGEGNNHSTNDTEKDIVYDWTFAFDASKVNGSANNSPLGGASFSLYEGTSSDATPLVFVETVDGIDYYRIATESDTVTTDVIITSTEDGRTATFRILGLDDATKYTIKEIAPPSAEFNSCPDVVIDPLTAQYNQVGSDLTSLTAKITQGTVVNDNASNSVEIVNNKGSVLPGTGGIGTTVFYLGGGAMAAVAGIYLISKKRMKNTQE